MSRGTGKYFFLLALTVLSVVRLASDSKDVPKQQNREGGVESAMNDGAGAGLIATR